jgi:DNA topoisomerase-1
MNKTLIFLESYTKRKTIKSFLNNDYEVFATGGHLMELEKKGYLNLGVDLEKFNPYYKTLPQKKKDTEF